MTKINDNHPTAEALAELERYLTAYEHSSNLDPEQIASMWSDSEANEADVLRVSTLRALLKLARAAQARVYLDHGGADWGVIVNTDGTMVYQGHVYDVLERVAEQVLGENLRYVDTISDDIRAQAAYIDGHRGTRFAAGTKFDAEGRAVLP